jgi:DNA repair exonuclease SbcCD ATPase subunit
MTQLLSAEIEGFGIFKDRQFIDFTKYPKDAVVGIFAENSDGAGGYDSNGSGKSTFFYALGWALFEMIPLQSDKKNSIKKEALVNDNSKKASVTLKFNRDGDTIIWTNSLTSQGTRKTHLSVNGKSFDGNTDTQRRDKLYSLLGLGGKNKEYFLDFLNTCYFSGDLIKSFASKNYSDSERLKIVSRLKKMEVIYIAIEKVRKDLKEINSEIKNLEDRYGILSSQIDEDFEPDTVREQIAGIERDIQANEVKYEEIQKEIEEAAKITALKDKQLQLERQLASVKETINRTINKIELIAQEMNRKLKENSLVDKKIEEIIIDKPSIEYDSSIEGTSKAIMEYQLQNQELKTKWNDLYNERMHLEDGEFLNCPKCKASLVLRDGDLKSVNKRTLEKAKKEIDLKMVNIDDSISENQSIMVRLDNTLKELKALRKDAFEKEMKKASLISSKDNNCKLIKSRNEEVGQYLIFNAELPQYFLKSEVLDFNQYEDYIKILIPLDQLKDEINNFPVSKYDLNSLKELSDLISRQRSRVSELKTKVESQEKLIIQANEVADEYQSKEPKKDMYARWIEYFEKLRNIELIEIEPELRETVNDILEKIGTSMQVQFKIDVENNGLGMALIEDSGMPRQLELFSTGQSNRIGFACGLALRDMAVDSSMDFGFTLWDEVLDGLDYSGQTMFFEMLKKLPGIKLVISHDQSLKNTFEHAIKILRKDNKSTILQESVNG